ncbi:MAG: DivIVA domain-containing protein [Jatrophihabitans sp.]|nr:MAG: DivIVA domain-containing protein [Jatrophihabitans sp.]
MPLTPAEVHNVAFKKPPIGKRGYDEEEVDAFLDIVELELSRLIEENNDLRAHGGGPAVAAAPAAAPAETSGRAAELERQLSTAGEENQRLQAHVAELERAMSSGKSGAQQQVVALQQQLTQSEQQVAEHRRRLDEAHQELATAQQAAAEAQRQAQEAQQAAGEADGGAGGLTVADHHQRAAQMLALAQQTADQHLAQTKAEADRLLAEAQQRSTQHVTEAEARAKNLDQQSTARAQQTVHDAEQRAATITEQFEQRKAALERRVEELRVYEREYRSRLRSYLESQLRDLDASGRSEPNTAKDGDGAAQG